MTAGSRRTVLLVVAALLSVLPLHLLSAQSAAPILTQTVRVFDATLVYPVPPWVTEAAGDPLKASAKFPLQAGNGYSLEEIAASETPQTWKRMLKVSGLRSPDVPKLDIRQAVNMFAASYRAACDRGSASQELFREEATLALVGILCGNTSNGKKLAGYGDGVGEVVVAKVFIVKSTIVAAQFSWRGPKFDQADQATFPVPIATIGEAVRWLDAAVQVAIP